MTITEFSNILLKSVSKTNSPAVTGAFCRLFFQFCLAVKCFFGFHTSRSFVSQPVTHYSMLKARVKLIYYFGLLGIIRLHLNLLFNELEFPHPAEYIHTFGTVIAWNWTPASCPSAITCKGLSQKTDMGYFYFCSRKGFVDNYRINSIGRFEKRVCIRIAKSVRQSGFKFLLFRMFTPTSRYTNNSGHKSLGIASVRSINLTSPPLCF